LVDRARALGWSAVEVIDDDLGRSGSGIARPGFEKLLAAICEGRVGAVVSIRHRASPATDATGIRCSSSAGWWAR
jgi:DNA invertase Pin-like site-specific DNA recombinase